MIKANRKLFKSLIVVSNYIEIFSFDKDCLMFQIGMIENCKIKINTWATGYTRLAMKFFGDGSWQ